MRTILVTAGVLCSIAGCEAMGRRVGDEVPTAPPAAAFEVRAEVFSGNFDGRDETLVVAADGKATYTTRRSTFVTGPQRTRQAHELTAHQLAELESVLLDADFSTLPPVTPAWVYSSGFRRLTVLRDGETQVVNIFPTYGNPHSEQQAGELRRAEQVWDCVWHLRPPDPGR